MRARLVSYLLGELSPEEAARLEEQVEAEPELKRQLEHLQSCMGGDADAESDDLPRGLADRTADSVHDLVLGLECSEGVATEAPSATSTVDAPSSPCRFTLVDAGVAAGVIVALGMMMLPALQESRGASRRIACQHNMHEIGKALEAYVERHGGLFPHVQPGENAGMFTMKLAEDGFVDRDDLSRLVVCSGSPLADQISRDEAQVRIPTFSELKQASGATLARLRKLMGGSYGYRLGYFDGPMYMPIKDQSNSRSPVLSDAPSQTRAGQWQSVNHGGYGQNVLFEDGSVSYRVDCLLPSIDDNIFVNTDGQPAAGRQWNDSVLVRSEVTPGVLPGDQPNRKLIGVIQLRVIRLPATRPAPAPQAIQ